MAQEGKEQLCMLIWRVLSMFFQKQNKDKHSQYGDTELATELTHSPLPCGEVYTTGAPETSVRQTYLQNGTPVHCKSLNNSLNCTSCDIEVLLLKASTSNSDTKSSGAS